MIESKYNIQDLYSAKIDEKCWPEFVTMYDSNGSFHPELYYPEAIPAKKEHKITYNKYRTKLCTQLFEIGVIKCLDTEEYSILINNLASFPPRYFSNGSLNTYGVKDVFDIIKSLSK